MLTPHDLLSAFRRDRILLDLLRGAAISGVMQAAEAAVKFGFNVLLARAVGADGAGIFYLALTIATLGAVIGRFGLDRSLLRHVAANMTVENYVAARGAAVLGFVTNTLASVAVASLLLALAPWLTKFVFDEPLLLQPLQVMAAAVVPLALLMVVASVLRALRQVFSSQLILSVMWPTLGCIGIMVATPFADVVAITWIQFVAMCATVLFGFYLLFRAAPQLRAVRGEFPFATLFRSSVPLLLVTMMYALLQWSPNIILGFFAPSAEVGIFALAARTAMLATFAVSAVNWLAAPNFAAFHKRDDLDSLRRAIQHATLLMLVLGVPVIIFLLAFPTPIMGLFGEEFHGGADSLVILTLGGLINTACGPAGTVLIMTGHERTMRDITLLALGVNWALSFLLAPAYGGVGIAVAVSAGVAVQNILGVLIVYRRFGILTLPIRRLKVVV